MWSRSFLGVQCYGVAAFQSGYAALTGHFEATVDFGVVSLTSAGASDRFTAKYLP